jgi:hypothetical protein
MLDESLHPRGPELPSGSCATRSVTPYGTSSAYDIMISDCLWHVYRMIGKLTARVYVLGRAPRVPAA